MEKLDIREEGVAQRYLEINGVWEDHVRYGITIEEWQARRDELVGTWVAGTNRPTAVQDHRRPGSIERGDSGRGPKRGARRTGFPSGPAYR